MRPKFTLLIIIFCLVFVSISGCSSTKASKKNSGKKPPEVANLKKSSSKNKEERNAALEKAKAEKMAKENSEKIEKEQKKNSKENLANQKKKALALEGGKLPVGLSVGMSNMNYASLSSELDFKMVIQLVNVELSAFKIFGKYVVDFDFTWRKNNLLFDFDEYMFRLFFGRRFVNKFLPFSVSAGLANEKKSLLQSPDQTTVSVKNGTHLFPLLKAEFFFPRQGKYYQQADIIYSPSSSSQLTHLYYLGLYALSPNYMLRLKGFYEQSKVVIDKVDVKENSVGALVGIGRNF